MSPLRRPTTLWTLSLGAGVLALGLLAVPSQAQQPPAEPPRPTEPPMPAGPPMRFDPRPGEPTRPSQLAAPTAAPQPRVNPGADLARAEADLARVERLVKEGLASEAELARYQAVVNALRARLRSPGTRPAPAGINLEEARAAFKAAADRLARTEQLLAQGYVSKAELDSARVEAARAKADLDRIQEVMRTSARPMAPPPAPTIALDERLTARDLIKARLDLARQQYELITGAVAVGRAADREELYRWSRRWMEAEIELAGKKSERLIAAQAHLARMHSLASVARARYEAGATTQSELAEAQYYRLEAEQEVLKYRAR